MFIVTIVGMAIPLPQEAPALTAYRWLTACRTFWLPALTEPYQLPTPFIHLLEPFIHLLEPFIFLLEPFIHLLKPFIHLLEPPEATGGDWGRAWTAKLSIFA